MHRVTLGARVGLDSLNGHSMPCRTCSTGPQLSKAFPLGMNRYLSTWPDTMFNNKRNKLCLLIDIFLELEQFIGTITSIKFNFGLLDIFPELKQFIDTTMFIEIDGASIIPMNTYRHTCLHTYMHTYMPACMHPCIHANMHTYIHAFIHTYTHT